MKPIIMTADIAHSIGKDVADRSMRNAGRKTWNDDDLKAYHDATEQIAHLVPGWTEENPL